MKDREFPQAKPKFFVRLPNSLIFEHHGRWLRYLRVGVQEGYPASGWKYHFTFCFRVWRLKPCVEFDWMRPDIKKKK
jgi:hypothetical protein